MMTLLKPYIERTVKKKINEIEKPIEIDKNEQIENFLLEFSGESEEFVDNETLNQLQKILARLLKKTI